MTDEARKKKIKLVRETIEGENLSYVWLIARLRDAGVNTCKATLSSVLAQTVSGPKMDIVLETSEQICKNYRKKFVRKAGENC